jgi:hypothetical protein
MRGYYFWDEAAQNHALPLHHSLVDGIVSRAVDRSDDE